MNSIRNEVVEAVNKLIIEQQKINREALFNLMLFSDSLSLACDAVPLADVTPLTAETYAPNGGTALADAIGSMVQAIGKRAIRTSRVLIVIVTDGQENGSCQFSAGDIRDMIGYRRASHDWQFVFVGPASAFGYARSIGVPDKNIVELGSDIGLLMNRLSKAIGAYLLGDSRYALRLRDRT
jgi:hypothetical protein